MRLGIYNNNASNDIYPKSLFADAGELDVSANTGYRSLSFPANTNLALDTRYWAAILSNDNTVAVLGMLPTSVIFWGI